MPSKTTIKILNKCKSSSQTRHTNLSCLKLNWKKRSNNKTLEKVRSNKIEGCGQKNIREIKILFDNSLIVSGVSLSDVKIGDNPADILLNNIANASCKNEDDAKLSYEVAHRLILKLAEYVTEKAANPVKVWK